MLGAVVALLLLVVSPVSALASGTKSADAATPKPVEVCRPSDDGLRALSGIASDGKSWYAVSDGGQSLQVYLLHRGDCSVVDKRVAPNDPYDVEDLALGADGTLWLADTGDNAKRRSTVAMHAMPASGGATTYRMTYPDGPHDAETLLMGADNVPHIVTKEPLGPAKVYRPEQPLNEIGRAHV